MINELSLRIETAVRNGVKARHEYYLAIDLPDEQRVAPPAQPADLRALETILGRPLPPSYRTFLELHNGWRMVDGGTDLFSVEDLLGGKVHTKISAWQRQSMEAGDEVAGRSLVIGASALTPTKYLLDPLNISEDGEWMFVQHHKVEEATVPSFLQWLEESVDEYRQLARSQGEDSDASE